MAELSSKERKNLPSSDFAIPGRRAYPIPDEAHGVNALARVAANGTPAEQAKVRAAVYARYPKLRP